ncbi:MAG TPA: hypothetical protein VHT75_11290, partial [Acidimicrobiales bacterium]|nr:hypothetical protein [Acidimicrobiales bacterium]
MRRGRRVTPRHRARATIRRRRHAGAFFSVSVCLASLALGSSRAGDEAAPRSQAVAWHLISRVPAAIPQFPVTAADPMVARQVSTPPLTLNKDFDLPDPAPPAAPPLPAQYLHGGSVDQGVDYLAPGGTPLLAMGPGVIIQEGGPGTSGFGPNIPVLQITAGPLAGKTV